MSGSSSYFPRPTHPVSPGISFFFFLHAHLKRELQIPFSLTCLVPQWSLTRAFSTVAFQQPFTTGPYGTAIPSSAAPQVQLPANFMMANQMNPYQMSAAIAPQQPIMQRVMPAQQPAPTIPVSTPQRPAFNPPQGTPTSMPPQQTQFSTPQPTGTPQTQTPTTTQPPQPPATSAATPQTPTFPNVGDQGLAQQQQQQQAQQPPQQQLNGTAATPGAVGSTPQSPATDPRDRERFAILLEINQELLYESIQLVNSRNELKKEQAAAEASGVKNGDIDYAEEERLANMDYNQ